MKAKKAFNTTHTLYQVAQQADEAATQALQKAKAIVEQAQKYNLSFLAASSTHAATCEALS